MPHPLRTYTLRVLYACGREFVPSVYFLPITWNGIPPRPPVGAIARDLYVSPRSVERWVKLFDMTGNVSPKESRHGPSRKLNEFEELTVLQMLLTSSGIYLHEVQIDARARIDCSTICRYARYAR